LTDDLLKGQYELVNAPADLRVSEEVSIGPDQVEFVIQGFSLPDKATLIRGSDGKWRLKIVWASAPGVSEAERFLIAPATPALAPDGVCVHLDLRTAEPSTRYAHKHRNSGKSGR